MSMTVWNPFQEMEDMLNRYTRATGRDIKAGDDNLGFADWSPTVDIEESDQSYLIHADIPGVDKKDIDVKVENGVLSISGEKHMQKESGKEGSKFHRTERFSGSFARSFTLPSSIDEDKVEASYKDGVLSLMIPKAEEVKPKAIDIKVD